jgi:hypothetical protein
MNTNGSTKSIGYFIECDLYYPKELYNAHNNYPLAVEQKAIMKNELITLSIKSIRNS